MKIKINIRNILKSTHFHLDLEYLIFRDNHIYLIMPKTGRLRLAKVAVFVSTRPIPLYLDLQTGMNLIRNLLSGKITFAIRVGGHIKKIRAWTIRRAIMFLSARESSFRPSQPLDSCFLLIPYPLRTKKYPLNIPHFQESFGAEYLSVSRKLIASQFEKHRNALHRDIMVAPRARSFFDMTRDILGPDTPSLAAAAFLSNIDLSMWGKMCSLSLSVSLSSAETYRRRFHGKKWDFVTDRSSRRMQKNSGGFEIPFPILQDFSRVLFRHETWRRYYCLYTALDYRWNMQRRLCRRHLINYYGTNDARDKSDGRLKVEL